MDTNNMVEKLKAMLDDPATLGTLSAILGSIQQPPITSTSNSDVDESTTDIAVQNPSQAEAISKIKQVLDQSNIADDPRINLLNSLKPYMRESRLTKMDQAIRIIQLSKMATIFKP